MLSAGVAELVDALDLGSSDESRGGSSPSARTKRHQRLRMKNSGGPDSERGEYPPEERFADHRRRLFKPRADHIDTVRQ